jgi:hypothetical protein
MIDGFDVVVVGRRVGRLAGGAVRRLQARAQSRGIVMLTVGASALGADLQISAGEGEWMGLGNGHGVASGRRLVVEVAGRRMPRPRRATMWLPDANGGIVGAGGGVDTLRAADQSLLAEWAN